MKRFPYTYSQFTRHGRKVCYFRKSGKCIRLPNHPDTPEFKDAYIEALTGTPFVKKETVIMSKGTLEWLLCQYLQSPSFTALKENTKINRKSILNRLMEESGKVQVSRITKQAVQKAVDKRSDKPVVANAFLSTMAVVFKWAVSRGLVKSNPTIGVSRQPWKTKGLHTWTIEQIEQFRKHHPIGTKARLALEMMLFLGLRRSDVMRVGVQHIKDKVMSIQTQKTGVYVHIPIAPTLRECINATPYSGEVFLTTSYGTIFSHALPFGIWFKNQCKKAGLPDECRYHGLRKAGATILANAGASSYELMAMYGWSKSNMAEVYTKDADRKKLASSTVNILAKNI
ncbi:MAG: tyrosine-type recombinase/integrase [Candidatus Liberibacter solanacearum]